MITLNDFTKTLIRAAAGTATTAEIAVPSEGVDIIDNLSVLSIARRFGAEVRTGTVDGTTVSTKMSNTAAAAISEGGSYAEHGDPTAITFDLFKYGGRYSVSEELAEDTVISQVKAFGRAAALSIARRENTAFITGAGTTEPTGVFAETPAVTTAGATPTVAELMDLDQALGSEWDRQGLADVRNLAAYTGPVYVMNQSTAATIRDLDSGNTFTDHNQGQLLSMFSRPVMLVDGVDDIGAGTKPIALVNFGGYVIGERRDNVRLVAGFDETTHDITWDYNVRIGGQVWDSNAVAVMEIAT